MEQERIIYSLNIEDVQTVASEILDRHLSTNEIAQIEDAVAERIDWFEAIAGNNEQTQTPTRRNLERSIHHSPTTMALSWRKGQSDPF